MNIGDKNLHELDKHLAKQDEEAVALTNFHFEIRFYTQMIEEAYKCINDIADEKYSEYDFEDEIDAIMTDIIFSPKRKIIDEKLKELRELTSDLKNLLKRG